MKGKTGRPFGQHPSTLYGSGGINVFIFQTSSSCQYAIWYSVEGSKL